MKSKNLLAFIFISILSVIFWFANAYLGLFSESVFLMLCFGLVIGSVLLFFPDNLYYLILFLLFIPLSLGNMLGIPNFLVLEALAPLILVYIYLIKIFSKQRCSIYSIFENKFTLFVILYFIIIFLNFTRHSMEVGFRILYNYFISFVLFLLFLEFPLKKIRNLFIVLFWITIFTSFIGITVYYVSPIKSVLVKLQNLKMLSNANSYLSTSWQIEKVSARLEWVRIGIIQTAAPISLILLITSVVRLSNFLKWSLIIFLFISLVLSGGRSFFFGALVSFVCYYYFKKGFKGIYIYILIGIFIYASLFIFYDKLPGQMQRIFLVKGEFKELEEGRALLFPIYIKHFLKYPLFGVGYGYLNPFRYPKGMVRFIVLQLSFGGHGTFLSLLHQTGLVGFLVYVIIFARSFVVSYKLFRKNLGFISDVSLFIFLYLIYRFTSLIMSGRGSDSDLFIIIAILSIIEYSIRKQKYDFSSYNIP